MLSPIYIAARGWVPNRLPIGIATDGFIFAGKAVKYFGRGRELEEFDLRKRIIKDDDEIFEMLAIIMPRIN